MDPQGQNLVEAILLALEVALAKERDNTRLMEERLRAGQAALKAKERERSMLTTEKDRVLALKEDGEKLVSDFLEADGKKNFDDQKAMMDAVVAMINSGGGDGGKGGGFDGFYERGINYLENAQNLNEKAVLATVKGTNSDGNDNSHGGGNGGDGGKGGGFDGVYGGPINDLENAQILDEEAVIATAKGTNSDGNGSSHGGGNGGGYGV
ncbi:PREDICTED: eggshell protein 2A [Theobroma cacao]|uniref:Eggshell protein 2A n=1 Tax=Theobroma cacao TaxID=3641 RepID=A0AB32V680_THECC|nr:PREDICTED: eggshell protein 2A [Theobroma cacao]